MERAGNLKELWITCPGCKRFFNVEIVFWEDPQFQPLLLHCPFCGVDFDKKESPKIWGYEQRGH
jgi:sarcosine oxidase delta subunit